MARRDSRFTSANFSQINQLQYSQFLKPPGMITGKTKSGLDDIPNKPGVTLKIFAD